MKLKELIICLLCLLLFTCAKSEKEKRIVKNGSYPSISLNNNLLAYWRVDESGTEPIIKGYVRDITKNEDLSSFGDNILAPFEISWSPDGSKIAGIGFAGEGKTNVFIFDPWGKEKPKMITDYQVKPDKEWISSDRTIHILKTQMILHPSWSPTGDLIAFTFNDIEKATIWLVSVNDKNMEELTEGPMDKYPCFSPDGSKIIYTTYDYVNNDEIMEIDLDDRTIRLLISSPSNEVDPTWSPDGKYIAFVSDRDGSDQIWVRIMSRGLEFQCTHGKKEGTTCYSPSWTPDGKYILYSKYDVPGIWMKKFDPDMFEVFPKIEDLE